MYGVLVVLLTVMGVSSAPNGVLPRNRSVRRFKIEPLPIAEELFEPITVRTGYTLNIFDINLFKQSYKKHLKDRELLTPNAETNSLTSELCEGQNHDFDHKEQSIKRSATGAVPRSLHRCVRTFGSLKDVNSMVRGFVDEAYIKLRRRKRKKKRRENAIYIPDTNLKINISISDPKIFTPSVKSLYVKAKVARTNGFDCTCDRATKETTKMVITLTPCECEADYEITEHTELCEGSFQKENGSEGIRCAECASLEQENTEPEPNCEEVHTEACCKLDPMPKHENNECLRMWQMPQTTEEPQYDYPTYKTYPLSELRLKKKPRMGCGNSEARVGNSEEPDLREIFSYLESTTAVRRLQQRKTSNKNKDKKSRAKLKKKYSNPKRKNNRNAQLKRKEVKKYKDIKNQRDSSNIGWKNIFSRKKGRMSIEESTLIDEKTIKISEKSEEMGCNCVSEVQSTFEGTSSTFPNDRLLDEMFRKFVGEAGKDKWAETGSSNSDDSVTLIINVEDEVIAPPVPEETISITNPLSVAVEEMLNEVKSKMTEALGTESTNAEETQADASSKLTEALESASISIAVKEMLTNATIKMTEISATTALSIAVREMLAEATTKISDDLESEPGIITAGKLKHVKESPDITGDPLLTSIYCNKFNSPSSIELLNAKPVAGTVNYDTASTTHLSSLFTEESTTNAQSGEEPTDDSQSKEDFTTELRSKEETTTEQQSNLFDGEMYSNSKSIPVIDADYDQIISRIYCNITEETHTTVDMLKHICEDRYGSISTRPVQHDMETMKDNVDYETFCFETCVTKPSHRNQPTKGQQKEVSDIGNNVQMSTSIKHVEASQHTDQYSDDDEQTQVTGTTKCNGTSRGVSTSSEKTTGTKKITSDSSKKSGVTEPVQTICFAVSDFSETEGNTRRHKTTKSSKTTKRRPHHMSTTPYPQVKDTSTDTWNEEKTPNPSDESITPHLRDEDTTSYSSDEETMPYTRYEKTTLSTGDEDTTKYMREDTTHPPPRLCDCTTQRSHSSRRHRPRTHHHFHQSTPCCQSQSPSRFPHSDNPIAQTQTDQTSETSTEETTYPEDNETHMPNEITATKVTSTTVKHKGNSHRPKKVKEKVDRTSHFRFYPPLSLYRTWLSPWAAIQMMQQPTNPKHLQLNNYSYNYEDGRHITGFSRQPHPIVRAMCQSNIPTQYSVIRKSPTVLGQAKGVYMGAIIVGNKYLPPGFYKLEDLKKLKNSGIPIPKIRGKKTINRPFNDVVGLTLKRFSSKKSRHRNRGNIKRKSKSVRTDAEKGKRINLVPKHPKGSRLRKTHHRIMGTLKETN